MGVKNAIENKNPFPEKNKKGGDFPFSAWHHESFALVRVGGPLKAIKPTTTQNITYRNFFALKNSNISPIPEYNTDTRNRAHR